MSDYIKREDAVKAVDYFLGTDPITERIENIPSADVAPVRHGRWMEDKSRTEEIYTHPVKCSACGQTDVLEYGTLTAYCPNCGAKMDEEENDGNQ